MNQVLMCFNLLHGIHPAVLAGLICLFSTISGMSLFGRAISARGAQRWAWLSGSAVMIGMGIWATFFIALMIRTPLTVDASYSLGPTVGVAALSILLVALGLSLSLRNGESPATLGGLLVGVGLSSIDISRIFAPATFPLLSHETASMAGSWIIGVGLGTAGLFLARRRPSIVSRIAAAIMLAIAIMTLNFIGVVSDGEPVAASATVMFGSVDQQILALTVTVAIIVIVCLSLVGSLIDQILSARAAREALRLQDSERRFRLLADATFEGIVIHEQGRILNSNSAFCDLVGLNARQVVGVEFGVFVLPELQNGLRQLLLNGGLEPEESALVRANGDRLPVEILQRRIDFEGRETGVIAIRDISERKLAAERMRYLAHHDGLTGLPNRILLNTLLDTALLRQTPESPKIAVLHIDLDRFRLTNEIHGSDVGDRVLRKITERLHETLQGRDIIGRIGNDEFAIIVNDLDRPEIAAELSDRLIYAITSGLDVMGLELECSACIGIAIAPDDGDSAEQILRHAGLALQRAKEAGKGTYQFFEASMDDRLRARRLLERDLKLAIENRQIEVYYQPLYSSSENALAGFEALARWTHPVHGVISPVDFIAVAEESGLIIQLGQAVLWTACIEAAGWAPHLRVAVNLSPAQFRHPGLVDSIHAVLVGTGLAAERLELEVTESVLIEETGHALVTMQRLKQLGIRLALDDFGTGYSSLSYLHRFPFDKIKIDRSFIAALEQDTDAKAIIRAVVALGHSLRMTVTAEGLETQNQLGFLRELSCDQLQGFLLGRPMPVSKMSDFMLAAQSA